MKGKEYYDDGGLKFKEKYLNEKIWNGILYYSNLKFEIKIAMKMYMNLVNFIYIRENI